MEVGVGEVHIIQSTHPAGGGSVPFFISTEVDACSWWEVDLGGAFAIESVKIANRWCGDVTDPSNCLCHLSHAAISLKDENGNWVGTTLIRDTCRELEVVATSNGYCE
jgi:hypothetical protein